MAKSAETPRCVRGVVTGLALALGLGLGVHPAGADPARHREQAESYLRATNMAARLELLIEQVRAKQIEALGKWYVPEDTRGPARTYVERAISLVAEELSWASLEHELVEAHMSAYTEVELRGLVAFYESPLGRTYLEKRARLVSTALEITERRLANLLPKLDELARELARELANARHSVSDR